MSEQVTSAGPSASPELRLSPGFVARERELDQLQAFLDRAVAGHGQVCFITGEAGAGKTALITEFARRAQAADPKLLVAVGTCNAQTGIGDPYLPFREVLRRLTGDVETGGVSTENASRLSGFIRVSGRAIAELGPDLIDIFVPGAGLVTRAATMVAGRAGWLDRLEQLSGRQEVDIGDTGLEQGHLFEQYTNVLQAMAAQQPLMLVLDDLQWADADSINLLFHLCRRIEESRVLIVGTYRPNDVALGRPSSRLGEVSGQRERHPLEPVLNELKRYRGDISVDLGQEDEAVGRRFVDALLDTEPNRLGDSFRQALFQHTGGHPLFTVELLRAMQERGDLVPNAAGQWVEGMELDWVTLPARVEGVIEERISRLEAELRETLTLASVEGEDFTAEVIARVQTVDARNLVRRLSRELDTQHRLVGAVGAQRLGGQRLSQYRFRHNLFQKYLYDSLDEIERSLFHEDVGLVLEELYSDHPAELAAISPQLARHFEEAGLAEKAQHYLHQAGVRARRQYANAEALSYLTRALALTPESDVAARYAILSERERVYDVQGARDPQRQELMAMAELAEALGEGGRQAEVALRQANYAEVTGDFPAAIAASERAVELANEAEALEREAAGYLQWGRALWRQADYPVASAKLEQALRLFHAIGDQHGEGRTFNSLANVAADQGDYAGATDYYEMALYVFREIGDRRGEVIVLNNIAINDAEQGDYAGAGGYWSQALNTCREIGEREMEGYVLSNLGLIADYQGNYTAAAAYYEQTLKIRREIDDRRGEGAALCNLGLLNHHQGDDRAARDYGRRALLIAEEIGDRRLQGYAMTTLGHALVNLGRLTEAADTYRQALVLRRELGQDAAAMESLAGLGRIAMAQGDLPHAKAAVDEILAHLETGTLDGAEEPFRVYLTCYQVLRATDDPRAQETLATAYNRLQEQAGRITDPEMRRSFLENVPVHREIVTEWTSTN